MIDADSPSGSYRAALDPTAFCATCGQAVCEHTDAEYQGIVTPGTACRAAGADRQALLPPTTNAEAIAAERRASRGFPAPHNRKISLHSNGATL